MTRFRLPMLAVLVTALTAAAGAHAQQVRPGKGHAVLPVWDQGSGKVEAVLLLEPAKDGTPQLKFGNHTLGTAFGLGSGDSLGLLCNGTSGASISSLASRCLLATLGGEREAAANGRRLTATTSVDGPGSRFGFTAGTTRDATLPAWLDAGSLPLSGRVEQNDLQIFGQKELGSEGYVSFAGTYARARLIPVAEAPGLAERWDSKTLSVGGGYGPFSANIIGRVVDGRTGDKFEGLGLGLTWRTPWSGQLTVGADNVVTRGRNPFSPTHGDDEGAVPYVRYEQGL